MKLRNEIAVIGLASLLCGCATTPSERYPDIPDYPECSGYDTSASCFVPNLPGLEYMSGVLSDELKKCGYNLYGNDAFDRKMPVPPDFVVEALRWRATFGCHNGDTVVYMQVIVRVRRPAVLSENKQFASFGSKPRDFQAISRRIIGKRPVTNADYLSGISDAMANMMRNPEFRKALQEKRGGNGEQLFGFDMSETELPEAKRTKTVKKGMR